MKCRACEIERNDEQVKQMPMHTCGKDGPVEFAQPKTAMTQSDAPQRPQVEKTDNELIAEFMGLPLTKQGVAFTGGFKTEPFQNWKYHSSWDWLMPVVEKIGDLYLDYPGHVSDVNRLPIGSHIQQVYKVVVEFIKWYNTQPKQL